MPWQFGKFNRRLFQSLFYSMEHYYKEAMQLYQKIHTQDASKPQLFDHDLWMKEKAAARASFIMSIAGIEAFANSILRDFSVRTKEDLPENLLSKHQKTNSIDYWRIVDKVYFLPTLCNSQLMPPAVYFKKDSKAFQLFEELVEVRNSIMHSRPKPFLILVELKPDKNHIVTDDFPDNFWPISKIARDLSSFNYECAKIAYDNIIWVRDSLVSFLEKFDRKYLMEEKIELINPMITNNNISKEELLANWKKYVVEQ